MLTVRGQEHWFSTHERMFLSKCRRFGKRQYHDLKGTRTSNLRIHAEWSNRLSCHFCYQMHWLHIGTFYTHPSISWQSCDCPGTVEITLINTYEKITYIGWYNHNERKHNKVIVCGTYYTVVVTHLSKNILRVTLSPIPNNINVHYPFLWAHSVIYNCVSWMGNTSSIRHER